MLWATPKGSSRSLRGIPPCHAALQGREECSPTGRCPALLLRIGADNGEVSSIVLFGNLSFKGQAFSRLSSSWSFAIAVWRDGPRRGAQASPQELPGWESCSHRKPRGDKGVIDLTTAT